MGIKQQQKRDEARQKRELLVEGMKRVPLFFCQFPSPFIPYFPQCKLAFLIALAGSHIPTIGSAATDAANLPCLPARR